jgi:hypothetical protein
MQAGRVMVVHLLDDGVDLFGMLDVGCLLFVGI